MQLHGENTKWTERARVEVASEAIATLAWTLDGSHFLCGDSESPTLRLWDAATLQEVWSTELDDGHATALSVSKNGRWVCVGTEWGGLLTLDLQTGETVGCRGEVRGVPHAFGHAPDGETVGVVGESVASLWTMRTGATRSLVTEHSFDVISFSPSGESVLLVDGFSSRRFALPSCARMAPPERLVPEWRRTLAVADVGDGRFAQLILYDEYDYGVLDINVSSSLETPGFQASFETISVQKDKLSRALFAATPGGSVVATIVEDALILGHADRHARWETQRFDAPVGATIVSLAPHGGTLLVGTSGGELVVLTCESLHQAPSLRHE